MSTIFQVSKIGNTTEKGNCTIWVSVTNGFATNPTPYFILSNPTAIEASKIEVGTDITEFVKDFNVDQSKVTDEDTGEERVFNWLVPNTQA